MRQKINLGEISWKWNEWAARMKANFENCFFVRDDDHSFNINRRGIIKDTFRSTSTYTDFQLRPNFAIALAAVSISFHYRAISRLSKVFIFFYLYEFDEFY